MKSLRSFTCTAAALLALLAPTAAVADDQGTPPGAAPPPAQQTPPPPAPVETQDEGDDAGTLAIAGTLGGLLALAGALIAVRERRRPARGT